VTSEQTQALTQQALAAVNRELPEFHRYSNDVMQRVQENPDAFAEAVRSGNPQRVEAHLASVYSAVRSSDDSRRMKLAAQTMVGASGRPERVPNDVAEWNAIMNARPSAYWE
jgi:hypothetical protein